MQNHSMKICPSIAIALLIASACSNDAPKNPGASQPALDTMVAPPAADSVVNGVLLDGFYATSTATGQDAIRLFDDDPATGWQTRPGAGPDEGLMLYFSNTTGERIKYVEAKPLPDAEFGPDARIQLYVNGQPVKAGAPGERIVIEDKKGNGLALRSLFLRFSETGSETDTDRSVPGEDLDIKIRSFPANAFVGLQSLTLFNEKGEALRLIPPRQVPGRVLASTTLDPESAYNADNLFDSRKEFAWVEGNPETDGVGETITCTFDQPVRVTAVQIWNGYQRSPEHYKANARVKGFQLSNENTPAQFYTLRDDMAGQKIPLGIPLQGKTVVFRIASVYPGTRYKDLSVSDIVFYNGERPFILHSDQPVQRHQSLRSAADPSPLGSLLDRRLFNQLDMPFEATAQSIILRSDGTFVLYQETMTADETEKVETSTGQVIADGNWQLLESTGAAAKVKVFGKWFDYSEVQEWYKGPTSREATKIFNDVLTIDNNTVKGTKMIGTFYRK